MYLQIGEIIFENVFGPSSFTSDISAKYAEHPQIGGKAILQKTGGELQAFTLDVYVHAQYQSPVQVIETLSGYVDNGDILSMVNGDGAYFGKFVVIAIKNKVELTSIKGVVIASTISITLKEYIDPEPERTENLQAISNALALSNNGVVPVRDTSIPPTSLGIVTASVTSTNSSGVLAVSTIEAAAVNSTQSESLMAKAAENLSNAKDSAQKAIAKLQEADSLAATAPNLINDLNAVKSNAELLRTYCLNGDLTNALTQSLSFTSSLGGMSESAQPLNFKQISRRP